MQDASPIWGIAIILTMIGSNSYKAGTEVESMIYLGKEKLKYINSSPRPSSSEYSFILRRISAVVS